jgi:hypothetical protein
VSACSAAACPKWSVSSANNCSFCPVGFFQQTSFSTTCASCQYGQSTAFAGSLSCVNCASGFYSEPATQGRCDPCPIGKYQPSAGLTFCYSCSGYHATNVSGATSEACCNNECVSGTLPTNGSSCTPCTYGTFLNSETNACTPCPPGTYGSFVGSTSINACPFCPAGRYTPFVGTTPASGCLKCPSSAKVHCAEGSTAVVLDPGIWTDGNTVAECVPAIACQGGTFINSSSQLCSEGYSGSICSSCNVNYFRLSGLCRKCIPKAIRWILIIIGVIISILLVRLMIKRGIQLPSSLKLAIFWFQVLSMYPFLFEGWPSELISMFNFFSISNLNIGYFGIGCDLAKSFYQLTFIKLGCVPFLWIALVLLEIISFRQGKSTSVSLWDGIDRISGQCLLVANLFSLQIFSSLIQPFNCVLSGDQYYLKVDPLYQCFDRSWFNAMYGIGLFTILYFALIPAFLVKRYMECEGKDYETFLLLINQICNSYRPECKLYEIFRLLFKFGFVIIRDVISTSRIIMSGFLVLLFAIEISVKGWIRPYRSESTNGLSIM